MRKEKLAASFLSIPSPTEVTIVEPDLDIPGRMAIACAIPIRKTRMELRGLLPGLK